MLLNLWSVRENPPSLKVYAVSGILDSVNMQSSFGESHHLTGEVADEIDWDISVDNSQIDWDIGTVEEFDDSGNGLGPYEIVDASEVLESSSPRNEIKLGQNPVSTEEDVKIPDTSTSEICGDVSIENPHVDAIHGAVVPNDVLKNQASVSIAPAPIPKAEEGRSQLLDTEYRNKILDDLYEVYAEINI